MLTYEELKEEAFARGLKLIKKQDNLTLKPCICGYRKLSRWSRNGLIFFKCENCELESRPGRDETEARKNWNKLVTPFVNETKAVEMPYRKEKVTYD